MTNPLGDRWGLSGHDRSSRADGGVHFEETVALSDSRYAGLANLTGTIVLVVTVAMVLFVPLSAALFFGGVAVVSGTSIVDLVATIISGLPPSALVFIVVFAVFMIGAPLLMVWMAIKRGGLTHKDKIHTRVTDGGIEIDREEGYLGQSSGVTIPFEAITAVEYNDPEGSPKMNLEDIRAEKFIGGRAGDWVRIDRTDAPAVYVGSDQPRALAEVVADLAPGVDRAQPFS